MIQSAKGTAAAAAQLTTVDLQAAPIDRFRDLLGAERWTGFERTMSELAEKLRGRVVWNVNSTARGGGVAELLAALIPYSIGCGIDERWAVIEGSPAFFNVTKRLHNLLHGVASGAGSISDAERQEYERTMAMNAAALGRAVQPKDVVILHDPQTAGLVPSLTSRGCTVIWRSHIGVDQPNDLVRAAWGMLRPYITGAAAYVFSRSAYEWEGLDASRVHVIAPTIDPFTTKNQHLSDNQTLAILRGAGVVVGTDGEATFMRPGDVPGRITHRVSMSGGRLPAGADYVIQVSRWDRLKDPVGVVEMFARHVAPHSKAFLLLAGPSATKVDDDPEQPGILRDLEAAREAMPGETRSRVLIAQLPMDDLDENAAIVNALQRRATVVVQKSLAEGFGLTVAEAMFKSRPVVASRVGGIEDQIESGRSGILVDDPKDLEAFGGNVSRLLADPGEAQRLGDGARRRIVEQYIAPRHLTEQAKLIASLL